MNDQERAQQVINRFPDAQASVADQGGLVISAPQGRIHDLCVFLKEAFEYDYLQFLTCVDRADKLELQYYLYSYAHKGTAVLKVDLPRQGGKVASVALIWKTANWHEREAYDLFGVVFEGHPDLKRILLEETFEGHPLLKDFTAKNVIRLPKV